jgi:2-polyprenyl-3-methyl-5-hydroxy-6-metoxy-1,4-benzoquinol methylase
MLSEQEIDWPFPGRRRPERDDPDYLGSKGLSAALRHVISKELAGKRDLDILDVGCGQKPFYPFFHPYARSYVGTDIMKDNPMVDRVCPVEALAAEDESADVVLCLSVLEHVDDPGQSVKELSRVVRPGGVVFATTHGCFPWHPYPQDHWRWTQTGLPLLFQRHGEFSSVELFATRGTMSGIFFLLAHYVHLWAGRGRHWRTRVRRPLTILVNRAGEYLDARTPVLWDVNQHVTAIPEFFVIARK